MRLRIQLENNGRVIKEAGMFLASSRISSIKLQALYEALSTMMFRTIEFYGFNTHKGDPEWVEPADW